MRYTSMKPIEQLTEDYNASLTRYAVLKKVVPAFRAELENWKEKTFNIRAINAIVAAIKTSAPELEVYGNKATKWDGSTYYYIHVSYMAGDQRKGERFDNQYGDKDLATSYLQFTSQLDRFKEVDTWISDTQKKLTTLPKRHAEATKRLETLKDYEDLID